MTKLKDTYLQLISLVGSRTIIGESFRANELVVGRGGCNDVAFRGDFAGKARYGAGDLRVVKNRKKESKTREHGIRKRKEQNKKTEW